MVYVGSSATQARGSSCQHGSEASLRTTALSGLPRTSPKVDGRECRPVCPLGARRRPVAAARARALDILGVHDLDAYLTVDGKVVEGEGQELVVVAGGGSRVTVQQRVRGGAARAALPRPPGTTSSGAEAAVALEPRERPREVPTMIFQDPLDTRLASQLKTLVGAAKAHIDDFVGVVAGLLFKVERVEESLRGDAAALRDQAGKVIQDM